MFPLIPVFCGDSLEAVLPDEEGAGQDLHYAWRQRQENPELRLSVKICMHRHAHVRYLRCSCCSYERRREFWSSFTGRCGMRIEGRGACFSCLSRFSLIFRLSVAGCPLDCAASTACRCARCIWCCALQTLQSPGAFSTQRPSLLQEE